MFLGLELRHQEISLDERGLHVEEVGAHLKSHGAFEKAA